MLLQRSQPVESRQQAKYARYRLKGGADALLWGIRGGLRGYLGKIRRYLIRKQPKSCVWVSDVGEGLFCKGLNSCYCKDLMPCFASRLSSSPAISVVKPRHNTDLCTMERLQFIAFENLSALRRPKVVIYKTGAQSFTAHSRFALPNTSLSVLNV